MTKKNIMKQKNKAYRVLSLDGGGIRGLYTASVLQTLSNRFARSDDNKNDNKNKDIGKGFDLIAGTSTGGILAYGLAMGVPIKQIIDFYLEKRKKILSNPFPLKGRFKKFFWVMQNIRKPANSNDTLRQELKNIFGNKTLGEIYQNRQVGLCITAVNLIDYSPRVFKTPHNLKKNADNNRQLADVCLASSATPIIFPIARIPDPERSSTYEHFVDGGLWANNPILVALVETITCSEKKQKIEIISIGTSAPPSGQVVKNINKGLFEWRAGIKPMEMSMTAQAHSSYFISDFLQAEFKKLGRDIKIYRLIRKQLGDDFPLEENNKAQDQKQASLLFSAVPNYKKPIKPYGKTK